MSSERPVKSDFVKSSPCLFRMIRWSMIIFAVFLFCLSILVPAPLLGPADTGAPPNPARSAWFLLWIQELVSHGNFLVYPALLIGVLFVGLPWLPIYRPVWRAAWFPRRQTAVNILTMIMLFIIVALTMVAAFFRGAEWQFILPF